MKLPILFFYFMKDWIQTKIFILSVIIGIYGNFSAGKFKSAFLPFKSIYLKGIDKLEIIFNSWVSS